MDSETTDDRMSYTWSEGPLSSFYLGVTVTIDHTIKSNIKKMLEANASHREAIPKPGKDGISNKLIQSPINSSLV